MKNLFKKLQYPRLIILLLGVLILLVIVYSVFLSNNGTPSSSAPVNFVQNTQVQTTGGNPFNIQGATPEQIQKLKQLNISKEPSSEDVRNEFNTSDNPILKVDEKNTGTEGD